VLSEREKQLVGAEAAWVCLEYQDKSAHAISQDMAIMFYASTTLSSYTIPYLGELTMWLEYPYNVSSFNSVAHAHLESMLIYLSTSLELLQPAHTCCHSIQSYLICPLALGKYYILLATHHIYTCLEFNVMDIIYSQLKNQSKSN